MPSPDALQLGPMVYKPGYKAEFSATHEGVYDGQPVMVKIGDEHLQRERSILEAVDHVGIPKVVDYFEDTDRHVLVMERMPGLPLTEVTGWQEGQDSQPLPLNEAITITDGLALCFEALSKAGFLYRDLNLAHVLVDEARISLVDLEWCVRMNAQGVARVDSEAGTWETMSPEEFRQYQPMRESSSTYTLGVVLLRLATGKDPFHISKLLTENAAVRRFAVHHKHKHVPEFDTNNPELNWLLTKALQPTPTRRFQTLDNFRESLGKIA